MARPSVALPIIVFLAFYAVAIGFEWRGGAFQGELAEDEDEPAHYVTGLMVRDYIAAGFPAHPLAFAEDYYFHYPKVALGHWPPFFYIVQSVWTLASSASRTSVLLLLAALSALLAVSLCEVLRRQFSVMAGVSAGLVMLSLPLVQLYGRMVMTEVLVTLLAFWATICFGRYLERENWRDAAWFGLWASLAILTKGTGLLLAMVPPIGVLLTRRWRLLARWSFWLPAIFVLALCGPWYFLAPDARHESVVPYGGAGLRLGALVRVPGHWVSTVGLILLPLVLIGLGERLVRLRSKREMEGPWAGAISLLASVTLFRLFVPAAHPLRHMITAAPVFMMFATTGVAWLLARPRLKALTRPVRAAMVGAVVGIVLMVHTAQVSRKPHWGMAEIAQDLLARPELRHSVFLVSSDARGEGAFISEIAMHDRRPGHFVLRGNRVLFTSSWSGKAYQALYSTSPDLMRFLEETPVEVVVLDLSTRQQVDDHRLLLQTLETYPDRWKRMPSCEQRARDANGSREISIYKLASRAGGRGDTGVSTRLKQFIEAQRQVLLRRQ